MAGELWLDGAAAKKLGLVDTIIPATKVAAHDRRTEARSPANNRIVNQLLAAARPQRATVQQAVAYQLASYAARLREIEADQVQEYRLANRARIAQRPEAGVRKFIKWS
jgi:enoyl-CoA hydratase/carnithine racemase